jgi:hypothetical protein
MEKVSRISDMVHETETAINKNISDMKTQVNASISNIEKKMIFAGVIK